ncbi:MULTISPECIES: MATE family efflux transporter [unclassified Paenibacillus]|uniref:MATE family efflux transporter n=1 Tax=unclassified Paenibacillus TaxID=185978 RepID=UPI00247614E1|nr:MULTISPECIES: MATE family efflux transporter [unclassified Paenibacillus]MDH6425844.1 putative MATE family efflux protein [Paenibacillus sp. PastH-4]MDH6441865.1 putative MATE family efflux protein [Paenibacillus sp. PastF-4]MDH6527420.1 putative MATE family efflux protein [Paenibacillus sp. PastH-3]
MNTVTQINNSKDKQTHFILNGNLWNIMVQLSWPAIIAMVLYGLNAVIAAVFVGRFVGEEALAGVSVAYPLTQISLGLGSLIGVGAGSALSLALGRQDKEMQKRLMGNVNYLSILVTLIYMVLGLLFSTQLVRIMGGEGETLALGDSYFRITVIGSFFWIYGLAANMIVRAEGKMKSAAVVMGIGLAVDVLSNYILVAWLDFGVEGAAWATNIGMLVYTLLGWIYFGKGFASFRTNVFAIYRDAATIKSIIGLGMSSFIMNFMNLVQAVVVFNALSRYGTTADIAFYGVVFRVFTFLLTPIFGLMRALQPVIGINFGAEQYERAIKAYKIFTLVSMLLTLPFWIISMISPASILGLMLPDQIFKTSEMLYFRLNMAVLPLLSLIFMAMTFFPAINKGKPAAVIGITRQLVFYVPVMLVLPRWLGVSGVYWGSLVIDSVVVVWTVILVTKEFTRLRAKPKLARTYNM